MQVHEKQKMNIGQHPKINEDSHCCSIMRIVYSTVYTIDLSHCMAACTVWAALGNAQKMQQVPCM